MSVRLPPCPLIVGLIFAVFAHAQAAPQIVQLNAAALWNRVEFRIINTPASSNPFDPELIRLDGVFTLPSGRTMSVPAFWFQDYQRQLAGSSEYLTPNGPPEWRLRFTPPEAGTYALTLTICTNGLPCGSAVMTNFSVPSVSSPTGAGYVRVASSRQYFETTDGQPLRLIGENIAWHTQRGTYDYDDYFTAMAAAGENYARILMLPWAFGLETDTNTLTNYRLEPAWRLDYVLNLAQQRGLFLLFCLDFHGMFEIVPDYWGGNNFWPSNPYNSSNGGPCVNQNAFFTNASAQKVFQKRLRYLIGRYGYSPNLLAWQLLSEIDNEYAYLTPSDVAAWHSVMGAWLHTNDPYGHLVTTSLTASSDRPEIWSIPEMDFTTYHSYAEPAPATRLAGVAQSFHQHYGKPVLIDEFGTDWRGWNRTNDIYLRGFRQGLWGGALGGSVGTAMSWWWENIHAENAYSSYKALGNILKKTAWGRGFWTNLSFESSSPSSVVGDLIPNGQPFAVVLTPGDAWGDTPTGRLAVPGPEAAGYAGNILNSFIQGWWHPQFQIPFVLSAWLTNSARLVMHLNSVSESASLVVRIDGNERFRTNLPNLDDLNEVNNEYNLDIALDLPIGKHIIEITNVAAGWSFLDWVRLEQVLPATYSDNWLPSPYRIELRSARETLLYVVAPGASFPAGATIPSLPLQHGQILSLSNWPTGQFFAEWFDPATAAAVGYSQATVTNATLTLRLPDFREDLAGLLYPLPVLLPLGLNPSNAFEFQLTSETGGQYLIEKSANLSTWLPFLVATNILGTVILADPFAATNGPTFFRARRSLSAVPPP